MSKFEDIIGKIESYEYTRDELKRLKNNASRPSKWTELQKQKMLDAIEYALKHMPSGISRKESREIVEDRGNYKIAREAMEGDRLLQPKLAVLADSISTLNGISDITVLKTQLRLYLHGKHFFAGVKGSGDVFWISCREDHCVSDDTISSWNVMGQFENSKIFDNPCIGLSASSVLSIKNALAAVRFD
ncbi:MAG: hypothetical protein ABNH16_12530 [Thalassolituus sp.]